MERFWNKIQKTDTCWIWIGAKRNKAGYGAFKLDGKIIDAHRYSYTIHKGEIPDGMMICHHCDNPSCVNPDHLFLGTNGDNMKDAHQKGRMKTPTGKKMDFGNKPPNRTLKTKEEIQAVKSAIKNRTGTLKEIAEELGIPFQLARDINCGRVYYND